MLNTAARALTGLRMRFLPLFHRRAKEITLIVLRFYRAARPYSDGVLRFRGRVITRGCFCHRPGEKRMLGDQVVHVQSLFEQGMTTAHNIP